MKKKLLFAASAIAFVGLWLLWTHDPANDTQVVYLLPEGLEGCVSIHFNQPNQQPLVIANRELLIEIPESGIVATSSSYKVIYALGWHKEKAFYVDTDGKRVKEIAHANFTNGAIVSNDSPLFERFTLSFDGREGACS